MKLRPSDIPAYSCRQYYDHGRRCANAGFWIGVITLSLLEAITVWILR
jgi:hypothetical protein